MESNSDTPVSILKVDFGCSRECPRDVKNMLEQLKGVKSISIDPIQGKVTVVGNVNPMMLIKLLQKMGKKAQLWSFDKTPKQKRVGSHGYKHKQASQCCCDSSRSEDDCDTDFHHSYSSCKHKHSSQHGQSSKKRNSHKYQFGSTDKHAAPPPTGYYPPIPGYQPFSWYHFPIQYHSAAYARPVPSYGYYGRVQPMSSRYWYPRYDSRFLQQHSPMIHYSSYADNYPYTM